MSVVVFIGPSLALARARARLDAVYMPPARQGDVYRVCTRLRVQAVGLVDGFFHQVPSVWHKEILWAMAEGVCVYGAASMGALRAAELEAFGMRGVGRIFRAYRDGRFAPGDASPFEDDDEVALAHAPAALGFAPASEPMVNVRATLERAVAESVLDAGLAARLCAGAKRLHYPERCWERVLAHARALDRRAAPRFERWLAGGRVDLKASDACELLDCLRTPGAAGGPLGYDFQHTQSWQRLVESN